MQRMRGVSYTRFKVGTALRDRITTNSYYRLSKEDRILHLRALYEVFCTILSISASPRASVLFESTRISDFLLNFAKLHIGYCHPQKWADTVFVIASPQIAFGSWAMQERSPALLAPFNEYAHGSYLSKLVNLHAQFFGIYAYTVATDPLLGAEHVFFVMTQALGNVRLSLVTNFYLCWMRDSSVRFSPIPVYDDDEDPRQILSRDACVDSIELLIVARTLPGVDFRIDAFPPDINVLQQLHNDLSNGLSDTSQSADVQDRYENANVDDPDA